MARSATDATRFTATGPHAYSKASTIDVSHPPPQNETPQQKVTRLREAARQAKIDQESRFDRVVARGRIYADRAHKVTVLGLIGLSVLCTGLAVYSLGDMMVYNRRKRREFFAEQEKNYNIALARAYEADAHGTLTPDLALVLNKERAVLQWEEMQKEKKGVVKGAKDWLFGSFSKQERPGGAMGFASDEIKRIAEGRYREEGAGIGIGGVSGGVAGSGREVERDVSEGQMMVKEAAIQKRMMDAQQAGQLQGGLLDQVGLEAAEGVKSTSKSWYDWVRRK